jgi:hypothetical protein
MRKAILVISSLCSFSAMALDYPAVTDPWQKEMLQRFIKDQPKLESSAFFDKPATAVALPCQVPEIDLYRVLGLNTVHPVLSAELDKKVSKLMRNAGGGAYELPKKTYSNIQITPVKAQCANGKLNGELEFVVSYDELSESVTTTAHGTGTMKTTSITRMHQASRRFVTAVAGAPGETNTTFLKMTIRTEMHYDDPAMETFQRENDKKIGADKETTTLMVIYAVPKAQSASFSIMQMPVVSAGVFSPNIKYVPNLSSSFTSAIDATHSRMTSYQNKQLSLTGILRDGLMNGESVSYMDNYLKKNNLRIDQMPGMENTREVTINGVDLLEMRSCFQNNVVVKMSPCPSE